MERWITSHLIIMTSQLFLVLTSMEPKFDTLRLNVTVKEKATAVLPCPIESLGKYEVVWTDMFATLLTHKERRIIDDDRISIERPYPYDWNLHIRDVRYSDQGEYNCQINTHPVKIKVINLFVQVPAEILDHLSSSDVTVQEGETVTLVCNATGTPPPKVTWFRLSPTDSLDGRQKVGVNGEVLIIHNVTRYCGERYQCMAFNEVQPPDYKTISVYVEFAPEIYLPNKRIGQAKGKETILECTVTAFPHAVSYWQRNGQKITTSTLKYRLDVYEDGGNRLTLSLRVFDIDDEDYGPYTCIASNKIGEDAETMFLYNYAKANGRTSTTTTTTPPYLPATSLSVVVPVTPTGRRPSDGAGFMSQFKTEDDRRGGYGSVNRPDRPESPSRPGRPGRPGSYGSRPEGHYATQHPRYTPQNAGTVRITAGKSKKENSARKQTARNFGFMLMVLALSQLL